MTGAEAIERLDGYLRGAVEAAPPSLHVTRTQAKAEDSGGCSKSAFYDDFTGQVMALVTYTSGNVSLEAATQYLDNVARL